MPDGIELNAPTCEMLPSFGQACEHLPLSSPLRNRLPKGLGLTVS